MKVLSFCFCKDKEGHVGLVKSYSNGYLTVIFDNGQRDVRPTEVSFLLGDNHVCLFLDGST